MANDLPAGFVLDEAPVNSPTLPQGFQLDQSPAASSEPPIPAGFERDGGLSITPGQREAMNDNSRETAALNRPQPKPGLNDQIMSRGPGQDVDAALGRVGKQISAGFQKTVGGNLEAAGDEGLSLPAGIDMGANDPAAAGLASFNKETAKSLISPSNIGKQIAADAQKTIIANSPGADASWVARMGNTLGVGIGEMLPALGATILTRSAVPIIAQTAATSFGNTYADEMAKPGANPDVAGSKAAAMATVDTAAAAIGIKAFGIRPFTSAVATITNEATGEFATIYQQTIADTIKNVMVQGLAIQPAIAIVNRGVDNWIDGKPITDGMQDAYVTGAIQNTLVDGITHMASRPRPTLGKVQQGLPDPGLGGGPGDIIDGTSNQPRPGPAPIDPRDVQPGDAESPIPTSIIAAGRKKMREADAAAAQPPVSAAEIDAQVAQNGQTQAPDDILGRNGWPQAGTAVTLDNGDGPAYTGTIHSGFTADHPEQPGTQADALRVRLDNGEMLSAFAHEIEAAGVTITPQQAQEAGLPPTVATGPAAPAENGVQAQPPAAVQPPAGTTVTPEIPPAQTAPMTPAGAPNNQGPTNDEVQPRVSGVAAHEAALQQPQQPGLRDIRSGGHSGVRPLDAQLQNVLGGHGAAPDANPLNRQDQRQPGLQPGKLSVGDQEGAVSEPPIVRSSSGDGGPQSSGGRLGTRNANPSIDNLRAAGEGIADRGNIGAGKTATGRTSAPSNSGGGDASAQGMGEEGRAQGLDAQRALKARMADKSRTDGSSSPAPKLPRDLAHANPRYNFGDRAYELNFASDIDRAAYITAQKMKSKRDADFLNFVQGHTAMSEAQVRAHGEAVRAAIKELARTAKPGKLDIPEVSRAAAPAPVAEPAKAPEPETKTVIKTARTLPAPSTETSVLDNIRRMGGIKTIGPDGKPTKEGQDIAAVLKDVNRPGLINNKDGVPADTIRESLQEHGWFGQTGGHDIQDLYDLMDKEVREGPQFHPESDKAKSAAEKAVTDANARALQDVHDEAKKGGGEPLTPEEAEQIVVNMGAHGINAEDAVADFIEKKALREQYEDNARENDHAPAATEPLNRGAGEVDRAHGQGREEPAPAEGGEGAAPAESGPTPGDTGEARLQTERDAEGLDQTIVPGAEKSAQQLAKAREAQGHGRATTSVAQKDAGGLFAPKTEETKDLFGGEPAKPVKAPKYTPEELSQAVEEYRALRDQEKVLDKASSDADAEMRDARTGTPGEHGLAAAKAGEARKATQDHFDKIEAMARKWGAKGVDLDDEIAKPQQTAAAATPAEVARQPATAPIEDFGDVLTGARKHYAEAYRDRMAEAGAVDVAAEPLSKSWPEPDYAKMLDGGSDPWTVGFIHAARDEIPTKPQKSWKLKGWVESVKALRKFSNDLLEGTITKDVLQEKLKQPEYLGLRTALEGRTDLYRAVGHDVSLKGIRLYAGSYSLYKGVQYKPQKIIWTVEKPQKASAFSNWPRILAEANTREEAIEAFKATVSTLSDEPAAKEVRFDIYSKRSVPGFIIGKKVGKSYLDLKTFDDVKSARAYLASNKADLISALERRKYIPNERKESNSPRVGADHRSGGDVTPEQFSDAFGFRGVQFGNYVEGGRRQADLNEAYDALMDMAGILDIPAKAISLNGELGLAFGARGTGGTLAAAAHYEPGTIVINLTKNRGAGSLAHEWWHAMDNYFSRNRGDKGGYLTEKPFETAAGIRPEMVAAFRGVAEAIKGTGIPKRSQALDNRRSSPYWGTGREMSARSFESYIIAKLEDQGASNDYLANIVSKDYWDAQEALGIGQTDGTAESYPYPTVDEAPAVRAAFDHLFQTVEVGAGESGTRPMFSRRSQPQTDTPEFKKWFGDSKVVDEDGAPLRVYHGTTADFEHFKHGDRTPDIGFHFGTPEQANGFAKSPAGARVLPVYLSLKNPLRIRDVFGRGSERTQIVARALKDEGIITHDRYIEISAMRPLRNGMAALREAVEAKGYDGIVYRNLWEGLRKLGPDEAPPKFEVEQNDHWGKGAGDDKRYLVKVPSDDSLKMRAYVGIGPTREAALADALAYMRKTPLIGSDSYIAFHPEQVKSAIGNSGAFDGASPDIRAARRPQAAFDVQGGYQVNLPDGTRLLYTEEAAQARDALEADLRKQLDAMGYTKVATHAADFIIPRGGNDNARSDGFSWGRIITAALDDKNPRSTANHEVIHAAKVLDLFKPGEWAILEAEAKRVWLDRFKGRLALYGEGEDRVEEAIAMAGQEWADDPKNAAVTGIAARLFQRLLDFIAAIRRVLAGHSFTSPESIFRKVYDGEVAARDTGTPSEAQQQAIDSAREPKFSLREGEPPVPASEEPSEHDAAFAMAQDAMIAAAAKKLGWDGEPTSAAMYRKAFLMPKGPARVELTRNAGLIKALEDQRATPFRPGLTPIKGDGETKVRGAAQSAADKAAKSGQTIEDLPEYDVSKQAPIIARATKFADNDANYEQAKAVAMGAEPAPYGTTSEAMLIAVENRATREGDWKLLQQLGTKSALLEELTTMGQRISMMQQRDPTSPVAAIKSIQAARQAATKTKPADAPKAKKSAVKDMLDAIKKETDKSKARKKTTWNAFISSIECKE